MSVEQSNPLHQSSLLTYFSSVKSLVSRQDGKESNAKEVSTKSTVSILEKPGIERSKSVLGRKRDLENRTDAIIKGEGTLVFEREDLSDTDSENDDGDNDRQERMRALKTNMRRYEHARRKYMSNIEMQANHRISSLVFKIYGLNEGIGLASAKDREQMKVDRREALDQISDVIKYRRTAFESTA